MIKIMVAYHKEKPSLTNEIFFPVRVGAAINGKKEGEIGDDTGENISRKNPTYNELTAVYWAYKNYEKLGSPEYIGLCHYRRYFIFERRKYPVYEGKTFDEREWKTENMTERLFDDADFIAPMPSARKSVYDNYVGAHHKEDIELAFALIREKYPQMEEAMRAYAGGKGAFYYNMFVFERETFFSYCAFLFGVTEEYEKRTAHPTERFFITEFLTGVYFTYLLSLGKRPLCLPVWSPRSKQTFRQAVAECKENFRKNESGLLFKLKPLVKFFLPSFLWRLRTRKTVPPTHPARIFDRITKKSYKMRKID